MGRRKRRLDQPAAEFTPPAEQSYHHSKRKKRKGKKKSHRFFFSFLFLFFVITLITLSLTVFFNVSTVDVAGNSRYSAEELTEATGVLAGDNLFRLNIQAMEDKLKEEFPYLYEVKLRRKLPSTLKIEVKETQPVGILKTTGGTFYIDQYTRALEETRDEADFGTPLIAAPALPEGETVIIGQAIFPASDRTASAFLQLIEGLSSRDLLAQVNYIDITAAYDLKFSYGGTLEVLMGDTSKLDDKLDYFKLVLDKLGPNERGTLDFSNPDRVPFEPRRDTGGIV